MLSPSSKESYNLGISDNKEEKLIKELFPIMRNNVKIIFKLLININKPKL